MAKRHYPDTSAVNLGCPEPTDEALLDAVVILAAYVRAYDEDPSMSLSAFAFDVLGSTSTGDYDAWTAGAFDVLTATSEED